MSFKGGGSAERPSQGRFGWGGLDVGRSGGGMRKVINAFFSSIFVELF